MTSMIREHDMAAHERLIRMSDQDLAVAVRERLGAKLTAYIAGVSATRVVHQWASGDREIGSQATRTRLGCAYRAASVIGDAGDSDRTVQAWFQGMNPMLEDRSPARVLNEADPDGDDAAQVLAAARQFAAVG